LTGQSSNPGVIDVARTSPRPQSGGYWIARSSRAMTVKMRVDSQHHCKIL
jgi:hypothetical protein